jgi:HK97 family phage prohead protease
MQNRAYSVLHVKAVEEDNDARIIRGVATTPSPDRVGDVVEPEGVKFKNPMPLLWQHRSDMPVGTVKFNKPTKDGITFEARFAKAEKSQTLKDRIDEAWESVKLGLVSAVSIGFRSLEHAVMKDGGYRFIKSEVYELSLVTIPAQAQAVITAIKSIDQAALASAGNERGEREPAADSSGQKKHVTVQLLPRRRAQHIQVTPR